MNEKLADPRDIAIIPILDGTNYGHWSLRMKIQLRSKDLLDVCEKTVPHDANTTVTNKWCKASYEAVNLITSRMSELVFQEVVNPETIEKAHLLWTKITERYASKRAVNRGRVWMDWQRVVYDGNLQNYIHNCRKMTMELEAVNIIIPKDLLSFSLLGKLADDPDLHQFVENLTLNEDLIEKPEEILIRLQDYVSLPKNSKQIQNQSAMALVSTAEEPYKIIYCCKNGRHNNKCNTHKKEECWIENPALRPIRNE
ncbi:hypothetical protein O181_073237 [Austropuccinia psidii MF-1]|uniref:DUF4219 domain-containing protein n=1 Tax=Austropuccinia psidii MF-1 TaxID=1389203 RepID=A0A9Q3FAV8_9BASI|nr:hypothetical protein [Austropuccinia psidii MF-1]